MSEKRLTLLRGGGGFGGTTNHAARAPLAPPSANTVREDRQISGELIPHPIPPSQAAPDHPFSIRAEAGPPRLAVHSICSNETSASRTRRGCGSDCCSVVALREPCRRARHRTRCSSISSASSRPSDAPALLAKQRRRELVVGDRASPTCSLSPHRSRGPCSWTQSPALPLGQTEGNSETRHPGPLSQL